MTTLYCLCAFVAFLLRLTYNDACLAVPIAYGLCWPVTVPFTLVPFFFALIFGRRGWRVL